MRSYTVELIGGPEDGKLLRLPEEVVNGGSVQVGRATYDAIDTETGDPTIATHEIRYRFTGGITSRGCLRAVIAP